MRKIAILILLGLSVSLLARQLVLFYLNDELKPIRVEENADESSDLVKSIFDRLASPPKELKSFVPSDVLRAIFSWSNA